MIGPPSSSFECFFVQVNYPKFAFPKSCINKQDQSKRIFHTFIEGVFAAFTCQESWTRRLVGVSGGQTCSVFLVGGSREQHFTYYKCTTHSYFLDQLFECLNTPNIQCTQESCFMLRCACMQTIPMVLE